ncbi:acyltransferase family protein [Bdellovibrio bacteriovorus]|uniref:lysophospholipid acyltransferase family protein n=1 Tax=Bdellovibrio bacteriovorus TaxID=959 RepID=UPI0021D0AA89|nr:lysophospholipid acyltransferase family protein [Bdellovibrio bacteriovorus]UXR66167.1 acyltransferase family protein [Bdellovibrio bacteriovorus]
MKNFLKKPNEKIFGLRSLDRDTLIFRVLPRFLLEIMRKYFRLEIEGVENIPRRGAVVLAPNHSGYSGFDAILLGHIVQQEAKRVPRVLTHHFWFLTETTAIPANKMGFTEATYENGVNALKKGNAIVLFPEGEQGNFKPTSERYQLQEFKRGFVRMALEAQCPIVPVVVLGAEETHINLKKLKFTKFLKGTVIPLPLNVIPLPAKWRIRFLEPIALPYKPDAINDSELMNEIAQDIQEKMQTAIEEELQKRGNAFL